MINDHIEIDLEINNSKIAGENLRCLKITRQSPKWSISLREVSVKIGKPFELGDMKTCVTVLKLCWRESASTFTCAY